MKLLSSFIIALVLLFSSAFKPVDTKSFAGVYGVYGDSGTGQSITKLTLHEDGTFAYRDILKENIDVTGNWEVKNNVVMLNSYTAGPAFHNKWKIVDNGMVAKSRKGLNLYRLVRLK